MATNEARKKERANHNLPTIAAIFFTTWRACATRKQNVQQAMKDLISEKNLSYATLQTWSIERQLLALEFYELFTFSENWAPLADLKTLHIIGAEVMLWLLVCLRNCQHIYLAECINQFCPLNMRRFYHARMMIKQPTASGFLLISTTPSHSKDDFIKTKPWACVRSDNL